MGKLLEVTTKIEEVSSMLVEEKKKSSNLKRKNEVKNLVEKRRPNVQVDLKERSDGAGDNSSEAQLIEDSKEPKEIDTGLKIQACKSKKTKKKRKKEAHSVKEALNSLTNGGVTDQDESYTISSGDEDCSKGMKKWITEYYQSRPGLQALQDGIDDFITAHEEKLEEAIDVELRESQGSTIDPTASPRVALEGRDQHPGRLPSFRYRVAGTVVVGGSKYEARTSSSTAASQAITSRSRRYNDTNVDRDSLRAKIREEAQAQLQATLAQATLAQAQMLEQMQAQMEMWRQVVNSMLQMTFQMAQPGSSPPQLPPIPNFFMPPPAQLDSQPRQPTRSKDPPKDQDDP